MQLEIRPAACGHECSIYDADAGREIAVAATREDAEAIVAALNRKDADRIIRAFSDQARWQACKDNWWGCSVDLQNDPSGDIDSCLIVEGYNVIARGKNHDEAIDAAMAAKEEDQ